MTKQLIENDSCTFEDDWLESKTQNPWFDHHERQLLVDDSADDMCLCGVQHDEEEEASNCCSACGGLIHTD